jgi:hypothetical protein
MDSRIHISIREYVRFASNKMDSRIQKWIREYFYGFVRTRMDLYGFANPRIHTKRISFLTTRIVDSFRRLNYKLPVS